MFIGADRKQYFSLRRERHLLQLFITGTSRSPGAPFAEAPKAINMLLLWSKTDESSM